MSRAQISALVFGVGGFGALVAATASNEWKVTTRASSVITATWVYQGLWMNCAAGGMASTASEIIAFMVSISGWVLVSSTLPTDYWKVSTIDGTVITTATYWANLWKMCVTDSTGVSNCKDFPSMLALDGYIQACRGLMIAAVSLGFFGSIFALFGMKCTKVGGSDKAKAKIACLAGIVFILSGLCSMTGCSLYANKITTEFFDPLFVEQKYELGAALFIGWAGASLCIIGGVIFCFSISDNNKAPRMGYTYNGATSIMSSRTKYHGGEDFKTTNPSKQFDKNAYV
ncbi:claudin-10 isoform X1 [Lagenorhynchus albirostris]|nr:claudin-10 isoform X1 [Lagenorhynchus obliquidens]XP_030712482.1 claudin-10 isoform X1 [Globicephala melas]XP_059852234.1 claudin-10 isoform X1 [Delphinus delphis]XP_059985176.1 claudin-10 isoform X1 [Lagenorhynchus albirostris]